MNTYCLLSSGKIVIIVSEDRKLEIIITKDLDDNSSGPRLTKHKDSEILCIDTNLSVINVGNRKLINDYKNIK